MPIWWIFGTFIVLNLLCSAVVDSFRDLRGRREGTLMAKYPLLTPSQKEFYRIVRIISRSRPLDTTTWPTGKASMLCRYIALSMIFEVLIAVTILANIGVFASSYYQQPTSFTEWQLIANIIFTAIYTCEAVMKLIGYGPAYFSAHWNKFDFGIVLVSWVQIGLEIASSHSVFAIGKSETSYFDS